MVPVRNGDYVAKVRDKSGSNIDAYSVESNGVPWTDFPAHACKWVASSALSRPAFRFDGINDIMGNASASFIDQSCTYWVVGVSRTGGTFTSTVLNPSGGQVTQEFGAVAGQLGLYQFPTGGIFGANIANSDANKPFIVTVRTNSATSVDAWSNGRIGCTGAKPTAATWGAQAIATFGAGGGNYGLYDVGEVRFYDTPQTAAEIDAVGQELSAKWGIPWQA